MIPLPVDATPSIAAVTASVTLIVLIDAVQRSARKSHRSPFSLFIQCVLYSSPRHFVVLPCRPTQRQNERAAKGVARTRHQETSHVQLAEGQPISDFRSRSRRCGDDREQRSGAGEIQMGYGAQLSGHFLVRRERPGVRPPGQGEEWRRDRDHDPFRRLAWDPGPRPLDLGRGRRCPACQHADGQVHRIRSGFQRAEHAVSHARLEAGESDDRRCPPLLRAGVGQGKADAALHHALDAGRNLVEETCS